jgi:hypothetical protein
MKLSLEQELKILSFSQEVAKMAEEEAKLVLLEKFRELVSMDAYYKAEIKQAWGIEGFVQMG